MFSPGSEGFSGSSQLGGSLTAAGLSSWPIGERKRRRRRTVGLQRVDHYLGKTRNQVCEVKCLSIGLRNAVHKNQCKKHK